MKILCNYLIIKIELIINNSLINNLRKICRKIYTNNYRKRKTYTSQENLDNNVASILQQIRLCKILYTVHNLALVKYTVTHQLQQVNEQIAVPPQFIVSSTAKVSKFLETCCGRVTSINHVCHIRSENKWCPIPIVII